MAIVFTDSSTGSSEEIHDTEITDAGKEISNRVATAQGKQGIWLLTFPDRENTGNLVNLIFLHRENCGNTGKILKI